MRRRFVSTLAWLTLFLSSSGALTTQPSVAYGVDEPAAPAGLQVAAPRSISPRGDGVNDTARIREMFDRPDSVNAEVLGTARVGSPSAAAARSDEGEPTIDHLTRAFSPNGDGDHDVARLRYRLPTASPVSVGVFDAGTRGLLFRVALGRKSAGPHVWAWDGRSPDGSRLPHDFYRVEVRTPYGHVDAWTEVDLRFEARVWLKDTFGRPARETQAVYPRSRVVRDSVHLIASEANEGEAYRRELLLVKDADGRMVLRRNLITHPTAYTHDGFLQFDPAVWEARDGRGRALPHGRYHAVVEGVDALGNRGTSKPLRLWVSSERLVWVEETRVVTPADAALHACVWSPALGACDSYFFSCGQVVPSSRFPGGMSHRAGVCEGYAWQTALVAQGDYYVPVAEAVRGVAAARVAFRGAPTNPGESDLGIMTYGGNDVSSSSGGRGEWFQPWIGKGQPRSSGQPRVPAGAVWSFRTIGTDSFDVSSFTLDLRYLAVDR